MIPSRIPFVRITKTRRSGGGRAKERSSRRIRDKGVSGEAG
jgi:hypothetical protein